MFISCKTTFYWNFQEKLNGCTSINEYLLEPHPFKMAARQLTYKEILKWLIAHSTVNEEKNAYN